MIKRSVKSKVFKGMVTSKRFADTVANDSHCEVAGFGFCSAFMPGVTFGLTCRARARRRWPPGGERGTSLTGRERSGSGSGGSVVRYILWRNALPPRRRNLGRLRFSCSLLGEPGQTGILFLTERRNEILVVPFPKHFKRLGCLTNATRRSSCASRNAHRQRQPGQCLKFHSAEYVAGGSRKEIWAE